MTRPLWIASRNDKKRRELERLLGPLAFTIHTLAEIDGDQPIELPEDEPDFAGNAASKAVHLVRGLDRIGRLTADTLALGDDSGLCVDALGGAPGVRSARWAGPTDHDRNIALLAALDESADRSRAASFACAICVADATGGIVAAVEERCPGTLLDAERGDGGFGYDPLFVPDELPPGEPEPPALRRSFAQLSAEHKDAVSHRGRALRALRQSLERIANSP